MTGFLRLVATVLTLALLGFAPAAASAGTQDFVLVNETGVDVYSLFISETGNKNWEEDMLGENVLLDGERIDVSFQGYDSCLWDMMVTNDEGDALTWQGLNLCKSTVVVLRCDDEECWAEYE